MTKFIITSIFLVLQLSSLLCQTTLKGTIQTGKNQPVIGANIYFKGTIEGTNSDEQGNFLLSTDLTGDMTMVVSCIGYKTHEEPVKLQNDTIELLIILPENDVELKEIVVYAGTFEAGDKKKSVVLNKLDMATNPVGFGDALSVLRTLPGTSNAGDEGGLFVRGGEQNETKTIIDGLMVESPYTAKMPNVPVRGRFSPMLFRGTVFSTGGYSAEYGQALSSVLILNSIDTPEKDEAGLSLFMSGANFSGTRKWEKSSLSASTQYVNLSPTYSNNGSGYAKGIDLFYRDSKSIKNGDFWISYSFINSRRNYKDYNFSHPPFFLSTHNLSVVYKHRISKPDSYISTGYEFSSGRPYINPNISLIEIQRTKSYNNLSLSIFHFTRLFGKFTMIYAQVGNILGTENIFGYRYADHPDEYGVYESEPVLPVSRRSYLIGLFVSFTGKPEM